MCFDQCNRGIERTGHVSDEMDVSGEWDAESDTEGAAARVWTEADGEAAANAFDGEREAARKNAETIISESEKSFGLGVNGVFERRLALQTGWRAQREKICATYTEERERMPEGLAAERQDIRLSDSADVHWAAGAPLWMRISGLFPNAHHTMSPNERAGRIRLLLRRAERMIRHALKQRASSDASSASGTALQIENCKMKISNLDGGDEERSVIEETVFWSPVRQICVYLEISQRLLSGLCREVTGMSIENVVDRIRAEKLRAEFKKRLKDFVLGWYAVAESARSCAGKSRAEVADCIFAALKSARRTRFQRSQWAYELGFSSYQRLFRAVLLSDGVTPHQLEIEALESLVPEETACSDGRKAESEATGAEAADVTGKPAEAG